MPALRRTSQTPYRWTLTPAPLARIANREKKLPASFIGAGGFGITGKAREYLVPLVQGESPPPYRNGLPDYPVLKNVPVPKRLGMFTV